MSYLDVDKLYRDPIKYVYESFQIIWLYFTWPKKGVKLEANEELFLTINYTKNNSIGMKI